MKTIYEQTTYADNNPTWHEEDSPWKAGHIQRILEENNIPHQKICEIGCGVGGILLSLERQLPGTTLTGYEISPYAFDKAKARETERTNFVFGDVTKVEKVDTDVALVIDVIEHVEDYIAFIKDIKRIGKYKVFHIPLDISVQSVFRKSPIMNQRASVGHIHYFFKDSALATLEDCGYKVIDWRYTASRLELPNQTMSSHIMRIPRRLLFRIAPDFAVRVLGGFSLLVLVESA
jgi:ubiquinone/menaquinone biosynthesis C-methylase UbiE